jgi:transcriptional regulator with XRE-family HTH domain
MAQLSQRGGWDRKDIRYAAEDMFATNLRRLRHARGLSQDDLAAEAGISRGYLAQIELGTTFNASLKIIGKLAQALDAEPGEFFPRPKRERGE